MPERLQRNLLATPASYFADGSGATGFFGKTPPLHTTIRPTIRTTFGHRLACDPPRPDAERFVTFHATVAELLMLARILDRRAAEAKAERSHRKADRLFQRAAELREAAR